MSEHLDERLRTAARTYRRLGNQSAESMFLEAADTICKIQAENAKLREHRGIAMTDPWEEQERNEQQWAYEDALREENAKLMELVREYAEIANYICEVYNGCGQEYDHCKYDPLNNDMCKLGKLNGRARELGVEVDG